VNPSAQEPFASWESRRVAACSLVDQASGWGERVDTADDDAVLAWAREYLPRIVALASREVVSS
jgi:hypothetical protein